MTKKSKGKKAKRGVDSLDPRALPDQLPSRAQMSALDVRDLAGEGRMRAAQKGPRDRGR